MVLAKMLWPEADPSAVLVGILRTLTAHVRGARGAAVADRSGLPIARFARDGTDLAVASGMSALIIRAAKTAFEGLGLKAFDNAVFEGSGVKLLVYAVGNSASLIVLLDESADLPEADIEARWAAMEIAAILHL